jgi:hypothetical protein
MRGVVWTATDWIVVEGSDGAANLSLWRVRPDGNRWTRIQIEPDEHCREAEYLKPTELPDGRVGLVESCWSAEDDDIELSLVAYHLKSGALAPLMDEPLGYNPGGFTWNPSLTRGLFSASSNICAGIAWMTRSGIERLPVFIGEGDSRFRVDAEIWREKPTCTRDGRADWPAWSPDGEGVAFFASPSGGVGGQARLDKLGVSTQWTRTACRSPRYWTGSYIRGVPNGHLTGKLWPSARNKGSDRARGSTDSDRNRRQRYTRSRWIGCHGLLMALSLPGIVSESPEDPLRRALIVIDIKRS